MQANNSTSVERGLPVTGSFSGWRMVSQLTCAMRTFLQSFLMAMARSRHVHVWLWYSRTGSMNTKSVMFRMCLSLLLWTNDACQFTTG